MDGLDGVFFASEAFSVRHCFFTAFSFSLRADTLFVHSTLEELVSIPHDFILRSATISILFSLLSFHLTVEGCLFLSPHGVISPGSYHVLILTSNVLITSLPVYIHLT